MFKKLTHSIHENKLFLVGIVVVSLLYWVSRLWNLTILPIFTDEAIYLRWAQIGVGDASFRLISLVDGKQPLLIWLFLPALKFIHNPLFAGRLVSVATGFFGMIGLGVFGFVVSKSKRVFLAASFLYLISPFFLTYDRLALYESLLTMITIWSLVFTVLLVKKIRLDIALILGMINGAGLLTKSSAMFFLYLLPLSLVFLKTQKKQTISSFAKWVALTGVVVAISYSYTFIMRLSPFYHIVAQKNLTFIYSFSELLHDPLKSFIGNLHGLTNWLVGYFTLPLFVLLIPAAFFLWRENKRALFFLTLWFLLPFCALALFGRVIYPRFILFMTVPLYTIIAYYFGFLSRKKIGIWIVPAVLIFLGYALYFDSQILLNPVQAPFPYADRQQFVNDWPSGYGIPEAIELFQKEAKKGKIVVGTEGTFGLFPYAFELFLGADPNIEFRAYWPVGNSVPPDLIVTASSYPTFLVFKETQDISKQLPLQLILEKRRGKGPTFLRVFQVKP